MDVSDLTLDELEEIIEYLEPNERKELEHTIITLEERRRYQKYPLLWIEEVLGLDIRTFRWSDFEGYEDHEWDGTKDPIAMIFENLAEWNNVVVESCTGSGKSFAAAVAVLWFLDCWPQTSMVFTVCPGEKQQENIWKHIQDLVPKLRHKRPDMHLMKSFELRMYGSKSDKSSSWKAQGFVADVRAGEETAGAARGSHAPDMLFIFDEANAIADAIVNSLELTCTDPHNLRLYLGNPDNVNDSLHLRFMQDDVVSITVSALDHPNYVLDQQVIPGATSRSFVESVIARCSRGGQDYREHPFYQSRVRGLCPITSTSSLVPAEALAAVKDWFDNYRDEFLDNTTYDVIVHEPVDGYTVEGETRIYALPPPTETWINRYIIGCDVAGSSASGDYHSAIMYDRFDQSVAAIIRMRGLPNEYVREITKLCKQFKVLDRTGHVSWPFLVWETNGVGQLIGYEEMRDYPDAYKYHKQSVAQDNPKVKDFPGWWTGARERDEMVNRIEEWGTRLLHNPERVRDPDLFSELQTLVYNPSRRRYEAIRGYHDDLAFSALGMSLAVDKQLRAAGNHPYKTEHAIYTPIYLTTKLPKRRGGNGLDNYTLPSSL